MNRKEILKEMLEILRELPGMEIRRRQLLGRLEELKALEKETENESLDTEEFAEPGLVGFSRWNVISRPEEDN